MPNFSEIEKSDLVPCPAHLQVSSKLCRKPSYAVPRVRGTKTPTSPLAACYRSKPALAIKFYRTEVRRTPALLDRMNVATDTLLSGSVQSPQSLGMEQTPCRKDPTENIIKRQAYA